MSNIFDANGLTIETLPQIITNLNTGLQNIYGADINLDQNSPDGQLVNIFAQAIFDQLELLIEINNGFNPDRAIGIQLDERVSINNVARAGGTYTIVPIDITVSTTVNLQGLDANFNNINGTGYTVQDNAGNQYILIDSATLTAGTTTKSFRAQQIGLVEVTVDTITTQTTIVLGVVSVNNSSAPLSIGQNQETDAQLRLRRQQSVSINSSGYLNGLLGVVLGLQGVSNAALYENTTNISDVNGIPAHGIWLIVEGGANTDIANSLYIKKSYGAPMKGGVTVNITTASGAIFPAKFDRPAPEDLWISFEIQTTVEPPSFDEVSIKQYIVDNLIYGIGQFASTSEVTVSAQIAITTTGGKGVPVNVQISPDGVYYGDYLTTLTLGSQFTLSEERISISILS